MKEEFRQELQASLYLHRPLPLHRERSLEAGFAAKKVLAARTLYDGTGAEAAASTGAGVDAGTAGCGAVGGVGNSVAGCGAMGDDAGDSAADGSVAVCGATDSAAAAALPTAEGTGRLETAAGQLLLSAPLRADSWPAGAPADGDYCNFGTASLVFALPHEDWRPYNRLRLQVRPHILGARILHLNVAVQNDGATPIPDRYFREGATVFDLQNDSWNDCIWEFAAMPRDAIRELRFYVFCSGRDVAAGETLTYAFRDIRLERVEAPEHEHGWQNPQPGIRPSTVGYWTAGQKTAVATVRADTFQLLRAADGTPVYSGKVQHLKNERGRFDVLDFSAHTAAGRYFLRAGDLESAPFDITPDPCEESLWRVLNFFFCERCGFPVPGKHGACHQDILARHNGVALSFCGGWHDAGDVSQQAAQTGEAVLVLFENARRRRADAPLYLRLMEEAQWGLDFVLRTRFGDGWRATSAGATRYTDGLLGNFDDVAARVHDHAYENFLFAGIEAYAAGTLRGYDDGLAACARKAAREDFAFAQRRFAATGVEPAHMFEHTYNSGLSQYYAVIVWAASCLYETTGQETYAHCAAEHAARLLACQEQGTVAGGYTGFFYRDESHATIVHFNHQAREHQFMQALAALCRSQPQAADRPLWEGAMRRYGDYLKRIAANTAPYGMLPAGLHRLDEVEDAATFPLLHVTCDYAAEKENYRRQLASGTQLGEGYVLRNFPVWFSFRGNTAVLLSMGQAAAIVGGYFGDEELLQIAREQMYWMWGKNPFGQSLVYGAGSRYCRQYAVLCGECVGEVPVGIETLDNEDVPYWPQNNNATFREVWVGAACRWLGLCAQLPAAEQERGDQV